MKMNLGLGALKPNKIKAHKKSMHAKGHMPAMGGSFGRKMGKPNYFC